MKIVKLVLVGLLGSFALSKGSAPSIFVPRQLSYNPIFENADVASLRMVHRDGFMQSFLSEKLVISAKPIYTQNIGSKFGQYFTPNNKAVLNVREDGSGDIGSLWFQVEDAGAANFYSSELSFNPRRRTLGMMLYSELNFSKYFSVSVNTAVINTRNNMNISESGIAMQGQESGWRTITQSFENSDLQYGAISGPQSKTGVDDIQIKLLFRPYDKNDMFVNDKNLYWQVYGLVGVPTGAGSQAQYLFEPLVGSKHVQAGLGTYLYYNIGKVQFQAEAKWRYAFAADEMRSFDLAQNGQWSRYLLLVNSLNTTVPVYPAINYFTYNTQVTPQNTVDLYLSAYWNTDRGWHCELGYDLWVRQAEKIVLVDPVLPLPSVGIADLPGIAVGLNPLSASTATISQGNRGPGFPNQIVSDTSFIPVTISDFNLNSGGAPLSISNSVYGTVAYTKELMSHLVRTGFSLAYEIGHGVNVPNNIAAFINIDILF